MQAEAQKKDEEECEILAQQIIAKKVKDVNLTDAEEKERVLQLYSFKMVDEADNIKNNTEKGQCLLANDVEMILVQLNLFLSAFCGIRHHLLKS